MNLTTFTFRDDDCRFPVEIIAEISYRVRHEIGGAPGVIVEWEVTGIREVLVETAAFGGWQCPVKMIEGAMVLEWERIARGLAKGCEDEIEGRCLVHYETTVPEDDQDAAYERLVNDAR